MSGRGRYGVFRWGDKESEQQDPTTPRKTDPTSDEPTEAEVFGAGIAPAPAGADAYPWDLQISPDGSYTSIVGFRKYVADLAWASSQRMFEERGQLIPSPEAAAELELDLESILLEDPRTRSVSAVSVQSEDSDTLLVDVRLTADDGRVHSTVFPVASP